MNENRHNGNVSNFKHTYCVAPSYAPAGRLITESRLKLSFIFFYFGACIPPRGGHSGGSFIDSLTEKTRLAGGCPRRVVRGLFV